MATFSLRILLAVTSLAGAAGAAPLIAPPGAPDHDSAVATKIDGFERQVHGLLTVPLGWGLEAFVDDPHLDEYEGHVSDSGEGRWTVHAAIDEGVPAPVLSAALYSRFESRGEAEFANRLLSAMRLQFGGHRETGK